VTVPSATAATGRPARVALQPCADSASKANYARTIDQPVAFRQLRELTSRERNLLERSHPNGTAPMWGSTPHNTALTNHEALESGDHVLFGGQGQYFLHAVVTAKWRNAAAARRLWGSNDVGQTWELMYSLTDLDQIQVPYPELNELWDYGLNASPRSFRLLNEQRSTIALQYLSRSQSPR
jgi:5-methylcytosine-specific restriction enzyme B